MPLPRRCLAESVCRVRSSFTQGPLSPSSPALPRRNEPSQGQSPGVSRGEDLRRVRWARDRGRPIAGRPHPLPLRRRTPNTGEHASRAPLMQQTQGNTVTHAAPRQGRDVLHPQAMASSVAGHRQVEDPHLARVDMDMTTWLVLERALCRCQDVCQCGWDG